ncbi:MAG: archease [Nitrosarchaeum sp.]|nr:archease [Nitrosarchaeum sp.]
MMKPYEFLEHTADVKFRAYGATLSEAFANAARALFVVVTDVSRVRPVVTRTVKVSSARLRSLLYDFLEELIVLQDAEGFLLSDVRELVVDESAYSVVATIVGDLFEGQYDLTCQIKAVTYSDMLLERTSEGWMVQVVPDI